MPTHIGFLGWKDTSSRSSSHSCAGVRSPAGRSVVRRQYFLVSFVVLAFLKLSPQHSMVPEERNVHDLSQLFMLSQVSGLVVPLINGDVPFAKRRPERRHRCRGVPRPRTPGPPKPAVLRLCFRHTVIRVNEDRRIFSEARTGRKVAGRLVDIRRDDRWFGDSIFAPPIRPRIENLF